MEELFLDLEPKIFENNKKYFYIGQRDIISIKKEELSYKNLNLTKAIKKHKNIPKGKLWLNDEINYEWILMYYDKNLIIKNYEIAKLDYGLKEEAYEKDCFKETYLLYETEGVWVDKTEQNKLKIWCESGGEDLAMDILSEYLDIFVKFKPEFLEKEKIKDKIDIFLFLKEKKKKIEIEVPDNLYKTLRTIRIEIKK